MKKKILVLIVVYITLLSLTSCGSNNTKETSPTTTLTLVTYDSFPTKDAGVNTALAKFTSTSGIKVKIINAGDTGTMLSKAELTKGNPEGDVMWGIDNTLLSRAIESKIFLAYESPISEHIEATYTSLSDTVTPVDYGDVCVNYDIAFFRRNNLEVPSSLEELTKKEYKGLLVTEDPTTSSPGLSFLLSTIAHFGEDGFEQYWKDLKANDVKIADSWNSAYYEMFSGSSGKGDYPLVVSYATSPPAEIIFADPPIEEAPTSYISATCFRQVEFAGVLRGTKHKKQAQQLVDFLISETFQKEIALSLFVFPARKDIDLPKEFKQFVTSPSNESLSLEPSVIAENRSQWLEKWSATQ